MPTDSSKCVILLKISVNSVGYETPRKQVLVFIFQSQEVTEFLAYNRYQMNDDLLDG